MKKNPSVFDKYSIEYICKSTEGFRLTSKLIERVMEEAKKVNKEPLIIIEFKRNDKENFVLEIKIKTKRK